MPFLYANDIRIFVNPQFAAVRRAAIRENAVKGASAAREAIITAAPRLMECTTIPAPPDPFARRTRQRLGGKALTDTP